MHYLNSSLGRLVSFRNSVDFEIIGMLFQSLNNSNDISLHKNQKIVIHIHGNYGNFYQNKFLWYMSTMYCKNGIDLLSVNTSSHDGLAEGYYGKNLKYVGSSVSDYKDSLLDIQAAIDFATFLGYDDILLQGHSLGCDRVIDFLVHSEKKLDTILLSPVDGYAIQKDWIKPETIDEQIRRIQDSCCQKSRSSWGKADFEWLSSCEYGAHGNNEDWIYEIPITKNALISILTGNAMKYLNLTLSPNFYINTNALAYIGKNDGLLFDTPKRMAKYLSGKFKSFFPILDLDADHDIIGVEEELIDRIIQWIEKRK